MRLVPCSQILEDLHESWVEPTFWLRFNSWTAATTVYTASKRRAEESCRGGWREVSVLYIHACIHTHIHLLKAHSCGCNTVVSGQWGVNPSLEWKWDYSIRSLERLWSADSAEPLSLSLPLFPCIFSWGDSELPCLIPNEAGTPWLFQLQPAPLSTGQKTVGEAAFSLISSHLLSSYSLLAAITTCCHVHLIEILQFT